MVGMKITKRLGLLFAAIFFSLSTTKSQNLKPGFDAAEYADMLWLAFYGFRDSLKDQKITTLNSGQYERLWRSEDVGLLNQCEIYLRSDSVVILSLRGTVAKAESWLENFYAGMIPARGSIQLSDSFNFSYQFASGDDALVHTGWTIGTGFLSRAYLPVLEPLLARGLHKLIITGHSQGGALSFLNTSFIHYHFNAQYPDLKLKTYASAAPKPGNLYYAYDFENITGNGYAFRVVNTEDWVPETPVTVQGLTDLKRPNPLEGAKETIRKQKWPDRMVMKHMYNRMSKGSAKAARHYQKYLGEGVGKLIRKSLPGFVPPKYSTGSNYMTAGAPIILKPNEAYWKLFPADLKNVFVHHMYAPYLFLLKNGYVF
jgi:hypothetical protein